MGGRGSGGGTSTRVRNEVRVEDDIREAYLAAQPNAAGWVGLANLRDRLNAPRSEVDAALKRMVGRHDAVLVPEVDQLVLTPRELAAGVRIGGEMKHAIHIDNPSPRRARR